MRGERKTDPAPEREARTIAAGLEREGVPKREARRRAWSIVRTGYGLFLEGKSPAKRAPSHSRR